MDIKKAIRENLQTFTAIVATIATVLSLIGVLLNLYTYPVKRDVKALEDWRDEVRPDLKQISVISTKLDTLIDDTKDIKSVLGLR